MDNLYHYSCEVIPNLTQRKLVFGETYDEEPKPDESYLHPLL